MKVINERQRCCLRVSCDMDDFATNMLASITSIRVFRRPVSGGAPRQIGEIEIASAEDLNFEFFDFFTASGTDYEYTCMPVIDGMPGVGALASGKCSFDDVFIGSVDAQYVCALNAEYSATLNRNVSFVQTYYAAYPHAVMNGNQKYHTGSMSGSFFRFDEKNCFFDVANGHVCRRELEEFLTNCQPKLMKVPQGDMWHIQINGSISETYDRFGDPAISFEWTEVDAPPSYGIVVIGS